MLRQISTKPFDQAVAILRAVFAALLEFDDVGADEPVAEDEALVDRRRCATHRRRVRLRNGRQELAVVHGGKKNAAAVKRQSQ